VTASNGTLLSLRDIIIPPPLYEFVLRRIARRTAATSDKLLHAREHLLQPRHQCRLFRLSCVEDTNRHGARNSDRPIGPWFIDVNARLSLVAAESHVGS
jgi:hypothetical protein